MAGPWTDILVLGHAAPAGSKTGMVIKRKDGSVVMKANGSPMVAVVDAGKGSAAWKQEVRRAASYAWRTAEDKLREPLDSALEVRMTFVRVRPKCHYRTGKNAHLLKDDSPDFPTGTPDLLKVTRNVEDALTGLVYRDDAATVGLMLQKVWGFPECVAIRIRTVGKRELNLFANEIVGVDAFKLITLEKIVTEYAS
jgi:Holliday junction resolvase RusA-like endonuclease